MSTARQDIAASLPAPPAVGADDRWALFLDVDGTLLDFAAHPDAVEVDAQLHADLVCLRTRLGGALALLSGRALAQLDTLFDWRDFPAAGLHGAELRTARGDQHTIGDAERFASVRRHAAERAAAHDLILEDKRRALALHFRHAPAAGEAAQTVARELLREAGNAYVLQHGDHIVELKPAGVDKGRALATLMRDAPFHGRTPWMLGDDLTDEDAFRHVNATAGVSVIVGNRRPTEARHALADPAAVRAWLHRLAAGTPS
ncbi:MAG TPA: trehalose-phosphatase [Rhodanobacteraceae bacterium]